MKLKLLLHRHLPAVHSALLVVLENLSDLMNMAEKETALVLHLRWLGREAAVYSLGLGEGRVLSLPQPPHPDLHHLHQRDLV